MAGWVRRELRRSQAVSTFGPGAIVDLRDESLMMGGIDEWPHAAEEIHEPNLERALRVSGFRMPPAAEDDRQRGKHGKLPAIVFPAWVVCPGCHRLIHHRKLGDVTGQGFRMRCSDCSRKVYPARLIVACRNGHVSDFPWSWWAHGGESECTRPALFLTTMGKSSTLGDLIVSCKTCGQKKSLGGALKPEILQSWNCQGKRPWLQEDEQECDQNLIGVLRGASNVYFPVMASSISIPPWSRSVHVRLDRDWNVLRAIPDQALTETIEAWRGIREQLGMETDDIVAAIRDRKAQENDDGAESDEQTLRHDECHAIRQLHTVTDSQGEFQVREGEVHSKLRDCFAKVILVDRLREVRALRGFTRIDPPDPMNRTHTVLAGLSRKRIDWLPAIEIRGEGIYIELNPEAMAAWETGTIRRRAAKISEMYRKTCKMRGWAEPGPITASYLLTHTLSHALIRQLAIDSGYSSASIGERLYVFAENESALFPHGNAGVLLYTSTPDSDGSLGGLVRQGETARLCDTIISALLEMRWCSSDPLCIDSGGILTETMNLAACHACMLVSETSCERYNRFLDRALLVGTIDDPSSGYFSDLTGVS